MATSELDSDQRALVCTPWLVRDAECKLAESLESRSYQRVDVGGRNPKLKSSTFKLNLELLTSSLSGEPEAGQLSCLRRLFWESHGLAVRDLRLRQEHGADSVLKKLPTSERVARAEAQKKRLNGLTWSPETEPSHQLVDRFVSMAEEQAVIYIRPELCTSRAQETLQVKQAKTFALGRVELRMALQRKSLAMDLAGLVSFQVAESWHTYLFTVREREVPKNMKQVSLQQILDADKRLWILLAEEVRGKIVSRPGADPVCDSIIQRLSSSNDVLSYLTPQHEVASLRSHAGSLTTPGAGEAKESNVRAETTDSWTLRARIGPGVPAAATIIVQLPNLWPFISFVKIVITKFVLQVHPDQDRSTLASLGFRLPDATSLKVFSGDGALASGFRRIGQEFAMQILQVRNENKLFEFCVKVLRWALDRHAFVILVPHKVLRPDQGAVHGAFNTSSVSLSVVSDSFKKALFANLTRRQSFPPELRQVLKGKRLLLFKELLEMYNYDDPQVWQLLRDGPTLTGCQDHPPYADHRYRPASTSTGQLESEAAWRRRSISSKTLSPKDAAILTELGASEVQAGFISGPFRSEQEVSAALGRSDWVATPRFVLLQGCLVNIPFEWTFPRVSGDRVLPPGSEWLGRCVDLAKANKQMAVPRDQRHLVVLCHHDEDGSPLYYISESLPFGAEGSVYGFVRTSRALSFLINEAIRVPSSVYFDDFPALSPRALAKSATDSISFLLSALGWKFSTDPEKAKDFAPQFDVLGEEHVGHITDLLDELGSGRGDYKLIPVIQGQLNFASNFVLGRAISPMARSLSSSTSGDIKGLCDKIKELLARSKPRKVSWHSPDSPLLIFTDAAFEKGRATLGAVVIDTLGGPADIYDGELPTKLVASWQRYADEQIICQAELAAAVSIRYLLRKRLAGRKCIYFIDNESARFSLIRAVSGVPSMQALASLFHVWDEDHPHYAWVER
ncbi:unnamed protein product, partial [Symbiodinium microadriaticum]